MCNLSEDAQPTKALVCDSCKRTIENYDEVGYDGPKKRDDASCTPFMTWQVLCVECEEENGNDDDND